MAKKNYSIVYVPQNLRYWRKERRWNVRQLAERSPYSVTTVSEWERGKRDMTIAQLDAMCRTLGIPLDSVFLPPPERFSGMIEADEGEGKEEGAWPSPDVDQKHGKSAGS